MLLVVFNIYQKIIVNNMILNKNNCLGGSKNVITNKKYDNVKNKITLSLTIFFLNNRNVII